MLFTLKTEEVAEEVLNDVSDYYIKCSRTLYGLVEWYNKEINFINEGVISCFADIDVGVNLSNGSCRTENISKLYDMLKPNDVLVIGNNVYKAISIDSIFDFEPIDLIEKSFRDAEYRIKSKHEYRGYGFRLSYKEIVIDAERRVICVIRRNQKRNNLNTDEYFQQRTQLCEEMLRFGIKVALMFIGELDDIKNYCIFKYTKSKRMITVFNKQSNKLEFHTPYWCSLEKDNIDYGITQDNKVSYMQSMLGEPISISNNIMNDDKAYRDIEVGINRLFTRLKIVDNSAKYTVDTSGNVKMVHIEDSNSFGKDININIPINNSIKGLNSGCITLSDNTGSTVHITIGGNIERVSRNFIKARYRGIEVTYTGDNPEVQDNIIRCLLGINSRLYRYESYGSNHKKIVFNKVSSLKHLIPITSSTEHIELKFGEHAFDNIIITPEELVGFIRGNDIIGVAYGYNDNVSVMHDYNKIKYYTDGDFIKVDDTNSEYMFYYNIACRLGLENNEKVKKALENKRKVFGILYDAINELKKLQDMARHIDKLDNENIVEVKFRLSYSDSKHKSESTVVALNKIMLKLNIKKLKDKFDMLQVPLYYSRLCRRVELKDTVEITTYSHKAVRMQDIGITDISQDLGIDNALTFSDLCQYAKTRKKFNIQVNNRLIPAKAYFS